MIYDTLVATAVGMCAAMVMIVTLVVMLKNGALDLQGYAEPADLIQASSTYKLLIQTWVGMWIAGFFLMVLAKRWANLGYASMAFTDIQHRRRANDLAAFAYSPCGIVGRFGHIVSTVRF